MFAFTMYDLFHLLHFVQYFREGMKLSGNYWRFRDSSSVKRHDDDVFLSVRSVYTLIPQNINGGLFFFFSQSVVCYVWLLV